MRVPLPSSIAAVGDSMTQAVAVDAAGEGNPTYSWSTGYHPDDSVRSHYERILARNRNVFSNRHNNAVAGAKMADALDQARRAVSQNVEYVTFLMGANDLCAPDLASMTSPRAFERQLSRAIRELVTGLPNARIYVVSVPDVYRLWQIVAGDPRPRSVWEDLKVCPSMFSATNTEGDRQAVRRRNIQFNALLRDVCSRYARCKFDDNAVFNFPYSAEHVSSVDYFHPSKEGQKKLAEISWERGYWAGL